MDQDEIFEKLRTIEDRLSKMVEREFPDLRVEQCQWITGKEAGQSNLLNIMTSVDPEVAFAPPPPERETVHTDDQDTFDKMFDNIVFGQVVDNKKDKAREAREDAIQALAELEDDDL